MLTGPESVGESRTGLDRQIRTDMLMTRLSTMFAPLPVWDLHLLGSGTDSKVYAAKVPHYGEIAVKVPRSEWSHDHDGHAVHSRDLLLQERDLLTYVRQFGVPAPRVYGLHAGADGVDLLVCERLHTDHAPLNPYELGMITARLHATPLPIAGCVAQRRGDVGHMIVDIVYARLQRLVALMTCQFVIPSRDELARYLPDTPTDTALLHMDIRPENALSREGQIVGLIDWFNAFIGDPALELCRIAEYGYLDDTFLAAYGQPRIGVYRNTEVLYRLYTATMLAMLFLSESPDPVKASRAVDRVTELVDDLQSERKKTVHVSGARTEEGSGVLGTGEVKVPVEVLEGLLEEKTPSRVTAWSIDVAQMLNQRSHGVAIRLSEHCRSLETARYFAHRAAEAICRAEIELGAPSHMFVEYDAEQESLVEKGKRVRTLLPHHDGGNASYLTPSILDDPLWDAKLRRTRVTSINTTRNHKMYQGFLITAPGDAASITAYYDLLRILHQAFTFSQGKPPLNEQEVARWTGQNIRRSIDLLANNGGTYLTLGAALGSLHRTDMLLSIHYADAPFTSEQVALFPEVARYSDTEDQGGTLQFFSDVLRRTLGMSWQQFRCEFEIQVYGKKLDLVLGHNLTLLHSGLHGGKGRKLEPICFVVPEANGEEYERWLWSAWRRNAAGISQRESDGTDGTAC